MGGGGMKKFHQVKRKKKLKTEYTTLQDDEQMKASQFLLII